MRKVWITGLVLLAVVSLWAQAPAEKWTVGTVMAFKPHAASTTASEQSAPQFEVTVRVGRTDYVVLYTEKPGTPAVEYTVGRDAPVLVGAKTLSFRNKLGEKVDVPILSRMPAGSPQKNR